MWLNFPYSYHGGSVYFYQVHWNPLVILLMKGVASYEEVAGEFCFIVGIHLQSAVNLEKMTALECGGVRHYTLLSSLLSPNTTFPDLIPILSLSWEPYLWTPAYSLEPPKCNRCQDLYFHLLNLSYLHFLWQK